MRGIDIFINCSVFEENGHLRRAGRAILLINSTASISNCLFIGNTGYYGGAFCAFDSTINVDHTTFTGNKADEDGGAMWSIELLISTAVLSLGKKVEISDGSDLQGRGGATYAVDSTINIYSCIFTELK